MVESKGSLAYRIQNVSAFLARSHDPYPPEPPNTPTRPIRSPAKFCTAEAGFQRFIRKSTAVSVSSPCILTTVFTAFSQFSYNIKPPYPVRRVLQL